MPARAAPLRCAVVGARRRRQGTGPFVARFLHTAGAEVVAVATTSRASLEEARSDLAAHGIRARGYTDVARMLEAASPDVVAIASPSEAHDDHLRLAAAAGCHVLCEKPFVWGGPDPGGAARAHVEAFRDRGLHLAVVAQWPYTLEVYDALHPGVTTRPPSRFEMEMAPARGGPDMVPDALPHALSLLARVLPGDDVHLEAPRIDVGGGGERATVRFVYRAGDRRCDAEVRLRRGATGPKPAAYAFDGHRVDREIGEGYRMAFVSGGRRLPLPDPLERLVRDFLGRLSSPPGPRGDPAAWPGTEHVAALWRAWPSGGAVTA